MTSVNPSRSFEPSLKHEGDRIALLLARDGKDATIEWVLRTTRIYRKAVLNRNHFASTSEYRRGFIESYCDFKRWLASALRLTQ
jgi:hypothetical protein